MSNDRPILVGKNVSETTNCVSSGDEKPYLSQLINSGRINFDFVSVFDCTIILLEFTYNFSFQHSNRSFSFSSQIFGSA